MATETLAIVKLESCSAIQIFEQGFIDPIIEQIEAEARAEASKLDISTEGNRKAIASLAYKVARSKTFIDAQRKALVADEKKRLKRIDEEGSRIWDRLERLQTEVRKPLTDWEEAEKSRIADHESELAAITLSSESIATQWSTLPLDGMRKYITNLDADSCDWQEFGQRAAGIKAVARQAVSEAIEKREKYDAEQAELSRLRAEAAEREQKEREERIAREATEKAERVAKAERERVEREKAEAEGRAIAAEARRLLAEQKAERDAKEAAERAEREKQAAIKAERERIAAKEKRDREEQERRESSARIRRRVLGEISEAIAKLEIDPLKADVIASALANDVIPHVTVRF